MLLTPTLTMSDLSQLTQLSLLFSPAAVRNDFTVFSLNCFSFIKSPFHRRYVDQALELGEELGLSAGL